MKAYFSAPHMIMCPLCARMMLEDRQTFTVQCTFSKYELCGVEFHAPQIELVPVEPEPVALPMPLTVYLDGLKRLGKIFATEGSNEVEQ